MKTLKKLGVFMDYSKANILEFPMNFLKTRTIESAFTNPDNQENLIKSESLIYDNEQHLQYDFYKQIGELILNYDEVLLFGPTDAKVKLFDILSEDSRFLKIKISLQKTDKLSENQQVSFVNDYFSKF